MWAQYDKVMLWYSLLVSDFASDFIQNKELGGSLCEEKKKKYTWHFILNRRFLLFYRLKYLSIGIWGILPKQIEIASNHAFSFFFSPLHQHLLFLLFFLFSIFIFFDCILCG